MAGWLWDSTRQYGLSLGDSKERESQADRVCLSLGLRLEVRVLTRDFLALPTLWGKMFACVTFWVGLLFELRYEICDRTIASDRKNVGSWQSLGA